MNTRNIKLLGTILGALFSIAPSYAMDIELFKKGAQDSFLSLKEKILAPLNRGVNARDCDGKTPLMRALEEPTNLKELSDLLSHPDIDVNAQDNNQNTILRQVLVRPTSLETIEMLLNHPNINVKPDENGITELMQCTEQIGLPKELVKLLLKHPKIGVNDQDKKGRTALIFAVQGVSGSAVRAVEELLEDPHIDVNARDADGHTALMYCVSNPYPLGCPELIVKQLLARPEIDIYAQDKEGHSAFDFAFPETKKILEDFAKLKRWKEAEFLFKEKEEEQETCQIQMPSYIESVPEGVRKLMASNVIGKKYTAEGHEIYKHKKYLEEAKQKLTSQQRNMLERHLLYGINPRERHDILFYVYRKKGNIAQEIAQKQMMEQDKDAGECMVRTAAGKEEELD